MMHVFTIGLAAFAGVLLLAIALYNYYQQERRCKVLKADPASHVATQHGAMQDSVNERVLPVNMADATAVEVQRPPAPVRMLLDERLDAIAYLHLRPGAVVEGTAALAALPSDMLAHDKPCALEGCVYNGSEEWMPVSPGQYYNRFRIGVQLANQKGPISEVAWVQFKDVVESFAAHSAVAVVGITWPDREQALLQGRDLDAFANDHDVHLHFTVHAANGTLWSVAYLLQQAQLHGFVLSAIPGQLVLPAERDSDITMLTLQFDPQAAQQPNLQEAVVDEFQLNMALSAIPASADPVLHIYSIASTMSKAMGGLVVDNAQKKRRVGDDMLGDLMQRLGQLYKQMDEAGFPAGSALLQRLLS